MIKLTAYRHDNCWRYTCWIGGVYDHDDKLDVSPGASEAEARAAAQVLAWAAVGELMRKHLEEESS